MNKLQDITKTLRKLEIHTNRRVDDVFAGNYRSAFKGSGLEVDDLRRYEDGDDVRHVDWLATAKTGQLFVRQYKETRELTTIILVDLSATMNFGSTAKTKKDIALELAALILFSALKNNDKFGAVLFGGGKAAFIPPRKGRTHLMRILRDIIRDFENPTIAVKSLDKSLELLMSTLKRKALCFLLSDEVDMSSARLLSAVSRKYDFVFLKINDPFENGEVVKGVYSVTDVFGGGDEMIDLTKQKTIDEFIKLRQEKNEAQEQLLKERKIDYLPILTNSDIFEELRLFFKKRQKRF